MIRLDDNEKMLLEDTFKGVEDRLLIRELVRRGRLRQAEASTMFWAEMRGDDGYMENVREGLLRSCVRAIADNDDVKPALIGEHPGAPRLVASDSAFSRGPGDTVLTADIVFLVARNKKEG